MPYRYPPEFRRKVLDLLAAVVGVRGSCYEDSSGGAVVVVGEP